MTIPTTAINESSPAGSDNIALGDNKIREFKVQNREILEVDHEYPSSGQSATAGQHKKVTLQEAEDIGTGAEGVPILGAQTVSGKAELVFTDEDDNDIQITSAGKIKLASGRLENNVNLTSRNQAGDGDVNLLKANTSNQAEVTPPLLAAGGEILPEITAPTTAANQGALYTKNDGDQTELYFREESDGDEVKITAGGVLNVVPFTSKIVDVLVTSTGSLAVTGVGFKPTAITFVLVQNEDRGGQMTGICDSSRNLRCSGSSKQPDGNVFFKYSESTIVLYREGGTKSCEFTVTSLDADGFTINRTTAHASALCYAICYK